MKLYYQPGACSLAPHVAAEEAGIPLTLVEHDRRSGALSDGDDWSRVNPKGYVPALMLDDGELLTEVAVVLQYLADLAPASGLAPACGTRERYRLQVWLNFIATELHKAWGPLFDGKLDTDRRRAILARLDRRLRDLEGPLSSQPYLMGAGFTVADAYLYAVLRWSTRTRVELARWPALAAFRERVAARPAVQRVLAAEGVAP